jgi:transposase InsO family protein
VDRQLIARKWTYGRKAGRRGVLLEIRRLVVRMAEENPTWGYTRIQGALKNVGHRVGRSTIRRILKAAGLPPVPQRPTSWHAFLKAHWGVIAAADFFTTEVRIWRGLVTYYTVFVLDLASRRVHLLGSTPHPSDVFMGQIVRLVTAAEDGVLIGHRVLICDRDRKWSQAVRQQFGDASLRVVQTPVRAPNANAYAERFVRSIKEECLDRMIPLGERHFRCAITEFVEHYHLERITKDSTIG